MAVMTDYTWIFALSCIVSFLCAFGIGANDLANSFGSSVGTKAITMWQAVLIAAVCEFCGAFFLGAGVVDTLKSGIANISYFKPYPALFLYGMFAVMCAAAFWDNFASYLELPVSTTHTTVGAIIGMALVIGGGDAVVWSACVFLHAAKSSFPYFKGFAAIVTSWFFSPLAAFIVVGVLYFFLRLLVLRRKNSFILSFWLLPLFVGATTGLITGFIIQVGGNNGTWKKQSDGTTAWISVVVAVGCALITLVLFMPFIKKRALADEANLNERIAKLQSEKDAVSAKTAEEGGVVKEGLELTSPETDSEGKAAVDSPNVVATGQTGTQHGSMAGVDPAILHRAMYDVDMSNHSQSDWTEKCAKVYHKIVDSKVGTVLFKNKLSRAIGKSMFYDVHECVRQDQNVANVWANAEVFDYKTERLYRYLQVFSAMSMSFAHGSNDVANAMGPFAAVYQTWRTGSVPGSKNNVPEWILAIGGAGIVVGLATYGYKIMRVLGVKSVKLTNVRGFVCEWSTSLVVVCASRWGLPISTTQVITGAIMSIGLFEGVRKGVNWRVAMRVFIGWMITCIVAAGVAATITALGVFTPSKPQTINILNGSSIVNTQSALQIKFINATANATGNSTLAQLGAALTKNVTKLNSTFNRNVQQAAQQAVVTFGTYLRNVPQPYNYSNPPKV